MQLLKSLSIATTVALGLSCFSNPSEAASITYNLTFAGNSSSGTGTATFDDSLLVPNQYIYAPTLNGLLQGFSANFSGFATNPNSIYFSLSDLAGWILVTDNNAKIVELNFFSNFSSSSQPELYMIRGISNFTFGIYRLSGVNFEQEVLIDTYITAFQPPTAVPEPMTISALLAFGSFMFLQKRKYLS